MITLTIKVLPKASKNEIVGWENERLKIRLMAVPEKGEANQALVTFLSKVFDLPKKGIHLVKGEKSRIKQVEIEGISFEDLSEKIENLKKK